MKSNDLTAYVDRLYRAVLRKTREAYAAEELAQGTFLAALSALSKGKRAGACLGLAVPHYVQYPLRPAA